MNFYLSAGDDQIRHPDARPIIGSLLSKSRGRLTVEYALRDMKKTIGIAQWQARLKEDEFKALKAKRLIEGRRPNLYVSAKVAAATETRADYIKKRAFDKAHYKRMVVSYLEKFGEAKRRDLDKLLLEKISDALSEQQKANWVRNMLQEMRREGLIQRLGAEAGPGAKWVLSKTTQKVGR